MRRYILTIAGLLSLSLALTACDKCADYPWNRGKPGACLDDNRQK